MGLCKSVLQGEEEDAGCFSCGNLREKLCSRETRPTVEALSWLSVHSPSSVSPCVCWDGERAVTDCFVLSWGFFPGMDATEQKSIIIILWWWQRPCAWLVTESGFISIIFLTYYGMAGCTSRSSRAQYLWCVCGAEAGGAAVLEHIFCFWKRQMQRSFDISWYQWQELVCICLKTVRCIFFKLVQYVFTVFCCCCLFLSKNKFNLLVVLLVSPFTFSLRRPLAFLSQCFSEVQVSTWIWRNWTFHTDTECHRKELHVTLYLEAIFKLCTPKLYQCYSWQLFKKKMVE